MTTRFLISFFCDDRPGVIETLSGVVEDGGGNWLDSRLSRLGGRFAGVILVQCLSDQRGKIELMLAGLTTQGISAIVSDAAGETGANNPVQRLTLLGPDRPGIVHELTRALHGAGFNVVQIETCVESAPMSGESLFRAEAHIEPLGDSRLDELEWQLDAMAERMTLEIDLHGDLP
ncbi:MAG: glycine cleavage system regulatory protein [Halieaceae bacterium]|jgi:glycine cleavage system regulatory protein